jgi:rhamnogalacturonyl hydrolase YesR
MVDVTSLGVPDTEVSRQFMDGMCNRMAMSFFKYGPVAAAYPHKVDAIESLRVRLAKYAETGNTEYLMDVANFAMIEFMHPKHESAFFHATDADGSPGRAWNYGGVTAASNDGRENRYAYKVDGD